MPISNIFTDLAINNRFFNLLLRAFVLGLIIFIATTYVPTTKLEIKTRFLIALMVVITYSVLDLMGVTFSKTKDSFCDVIC
jgi:hypothetical protein